MIDERHLQDGLVNSKFDDSAIEELRGRRQPGEVILTGGGGGDAGFEAYYARVQPGDLITAEFMNALLRRLAKLEQFARLTRADQSGAVRVMSLFGVSLGDALSRIQDTGGELRVGVVLDVTGERVDPTDASGGRTRRVLGQYPVPDERVQSGMKVNLLVSPAGRTKVAPGAGLKALGVDVQGLMSDTIAKVVEGQIDKRYKWGDTLARDQNTEKPGVDTVDTSPMMRTDPAHNMVAGEPAGGAAGVSAAPAASRGRASSSKGGGAAKKRRARSGSDATTGKKEPR